MTVPSSINPIEKTYDGNAFDMQVSLADFSFSGSDCLIDHYIVTCIDEDSKSRAIKWIKTNSGWTLEELTFFFDRSTKCDWFGMTDATADGFG